MINWDAPCDPTTDLKHRRVLIILVIEFLQDSCYRSKYGLPRDSLVTTQRLPRDFREIPKRFPRDSKDPRDYSGTSQRFTKGIGRSKSAKESGGASLPRSRCQCRCQFCPTGSPKWLPNAPPGIRFFRFFYSAKIPLKNGCPGLEILAKLEIRKCTWFLEPTFRAKTDLKHKFSRAFLNLKFSRAFLNLKFINFLVFLASQFSCCDSLCMS